MAVRDLARNLHRAAHVASSGLFVPPGHYYSPIPNSHDILRELHADSALVGIDLRRNEQLALAQRLAPLWAELPAARDANWRWHDGPANRMYCRADAALLYSMIADRKPRQVIEVGSGYSSALALDAADRHSRNTAFTFIEPNPDRLLGLLQDRDKQRVAIRRCLVQDVAADEFAGLGPGDILIIDSTHVAKAGSDVLHLYFDVLPRLRSGVVVHVHDIFWPFSYPKKWLDQGRAWNETYLLRALLVQPSLLRILLWGSWLWRARPRLLPGVAEPGAIWLDLR